METHSNVLLFSSIFPMLSVLRSERALIDPSSRYGLTCYCSNERQRPHPVNTWQARDIRNVGACRLALLGTVRTDVETFRGLRLLERLYSSHTRQTTERDSKLVVINTDDQQVLIVVASQARDEVPGDSVNNDSELKKNN